MDLEKKVGKSLLKRIRWGVVFGLLALIELMIIIVLLQPMSVGCEVQGNICIVKSWVDPTKIKAGDEGSLLIEVKNVGTKDVDVNVSAISREGVVFMNGSEEIGRGANDSYKSIGPGGIRTFAFTIKAEDDAHEGKYLFDIEVREGTNTAKDTTYVTIVKKK